MQETSRIFVAGHRGLAGSAISRRLRQLGFNNLIVRTRQELAPLLARGASIGRIAQGHYFRGGQLLIGLLRALRTVERVLEIQQQREGVRVKL